VEEPPKQLAQINQISAYISAENKFRRMSGQNIHVEWNKYNSAKLKHTDLALSTPPPTNTGIQNRRAGNNTYQLLLLGVYL
jgi:hypothetical protein